MIQILSQALLNKQDLSILHQVSFLIGDRKKNAKKVGLLKRLKNIENESEEQLKTIEDQKEVQTKIIRKNKVKLPLLKSIYSQ